MADDDLEPIPLEPTESPTADDEADAAAPASVALRDRFLFAVAIVVAVALILLGVQLRSIRSDTRRDADCSQALVAAVTANGLRTSAEQRDVFEQRVSDCLGTTVTLPGGIGQ